MLLLNKKDGKVENSLGFFQALELLPDGVYQLKNRPRTNPQNSYLHALFGSIAEDTGTDLEYIKYHFKDKYLKVHIYKNPHIRSTRDLDTKEFGEFVDKILNDIAERGYTYMTPEEYKKKNFFK